MKAIKLFAMMLVALVGMTACSNDDDETNNQVKETLYEGETSVQVAGENYPATITVKVVKNEDGTINVEIPYYVLTGTRMGDIEVGASTISNIAYDAEKGAYYREYGADGLQIHLNYRGTEADYPFSSDSYIEAKLTDTGLIMTNSFKPGKMPFPIVEAFEGTIPSEK